MSEPVKDPVSPEHKRFVLGQAGLRLAIFAVALVAMIALLVFRGG